MPQSFEPARYAVLIVDNNPLLRMNVSDMLEDAGFQPIEANDVDAAEVLLVEYADEITLLFSAVQMPGVRDGFDLARMVAQRWPNISILLASGVQKPEPGMMPDSAVFVGKPFSAQTIYDCLQILLPDGKKPDPLKVKTRQH